MNNQARLPLLWKWLIGSRVRRWVKGVVLVGFGLLVGLALVEAGLRFVGVHDMRELPLMMNRIPADQGDTCLLPALYDASRTR